MGVKLPSAPAKLRKTGKAKIYSGKPVTETLTNGFFTVDNKWTVKYWNKAAEKLLGVEARDIVGKNLWEQFAATIPIEFYAVYDKAFLQEAPVHFEEYWGEMGAWFDVVTYYCDDTFSVSFKNSNHPHAEYPENPIQRLNTLTELYRFVTEITNDCLWEWDLPNKELFWIDGGHKRIMGYKIENALIPQSFWESCLHPEDRERVLNGLNKLLREGTEELWEDEYRFKKANGEYAYVHDRAHIVYDDEKTALRMIGATQDITEKVLLEKKIILDHENRRREITAAVLTAQENEREEIGKELHDNLNQTLAVVKMYVQMAHKNGKNGKRYLEKSSELIDKVIEEIRMISKNLVIPDIHIIGFLENISNLLIDLQKVHPVKIEFHHEGIDESELGAKFQVAVFRIVQEQLNNILKHAHATRAGIYLNRVGDTIVLVISDNGDGSDLAKDRKGVGIINIKSRADLYHGEVTITSEPGKGYELKVVLPLI